MDKHDGVLRKDRALYLHLVVEDGAEERHEMHADERLSCHTHQAWVKDCTPLHQNTPLF